LPKINVNVNHKLGRQGAVNRVKQLTSNSSSEITKEISELKNVWNKDSSEFTCLVRGIRISGALQVNDDYLLISGNLPLVFFPLRKQIEKMIRDYAAALLL